MKLCSIKQFLKSYDSFHAKIEQIKATSTSATAFQRNSTPGPDSTGDLDFQ